nr:recombinase family protein [Pseudonocardia sp. H11422]
MVSFQRSFALHLNRPASLQIRRVTHAVYAPMSRQRGFAIHLRSCGSGTGGCPRGTSTPRLRSTRCAWQAATRSSSTRPPGSWPAAPSSTRLLSANRPGDQLVVTKLDRLGRSLEHLIELARDLQARGVDLVVLDQGIDTSTAVGRMFFQILGSITEFEHALMSERTMDGLAAARARGRTGGQKPKLGPRQVKLAQQMYDEVGEDGKRTYTVAQIAAEFGRHPAHHLPAPRQELIQYDLGDPIQVTYIPS